MSEKFNISEETYVKNQIEAINGMVVGDSSIYTNLNGITYLSKDMQRPRVFSRDNVRKALSLTFGTCSRNIKLRIKTK